VQGSDGNFYGTTSYGVDFFGAPFRLPYPFRGSGAVFKMSTNGVLAPVFDFGGTAGANPVAGLVQDSDGNFYGTTSSGGFGGAGTVFRLTIVPEFQAVTLTNSTLSLAWSTEAGARYQLQCNSDLSSSNWQFVGLRPLINCKLLIINML
jgi:uncharacterized repeat protein (TIGR03803 family)